MKTTKRIRKALEAPFLRVALAVVPRLPRCAVLGLARVMGNAAYVFSARARRMAWANLDLAFGETKTAAEKRWILRESNRNLALVMLDLLWFSRNSVARMGRWFEAAPSLQRILGGHTPRMAVTGHFGNWELIGRYGALKGTPLLSVMMPLKNPAVNELLKRERQLTGQQVIGRQGALKKMVRFLREGGTVGIALDQNTAPEAGGVFAEFFGKPVAVSPAAGLLASMTGAEIVIVYALPRPDGTYLGEVSHVISPAEIAARDRRSVSREITQQITGFYEEAIRAHPECWLWGYKRWRHIPVGMSSQNFPYYANQLQVLPAVS